MPFSTETKALGSSFRDPAGFVFREDGVVKRALTRFGAADYDLFIQSGLYDLLVQEKRLVSHAVESSEGREIEKILVPQQIPVITYPYEWCFSQLKDAALLTLDIQLTAMERGMSLKDASPYNVQFEGNTPIFIDTLSFEKLKETPWVAYRQFCESFLAPLVLMCKVRPDFNKYLSTDISGVDLGFCSRVLPRATWFNFGYLAHIHLHALSQAKFSDGRAAEKKSTDSFKMSKPRLISLIQSLRSFTQSLGLKREKTAFSDYYGDCRHYSDAAEKFKTEKVLAWALLEKPALALDLGGNDGKFSRLITEKKIHVLCADSDAYCVEDNYQNSKKNGDAFMLPVVLDLVNPPGDLGWDNGERSAFFKRVKPDLVLALALIHHLRIPCGISMEFLASFFARISPKLILEFVPKGDPMVNKLLQNREDCFHDYNQDSFEKSFGAYFDVIEKTSVPDTQRTLYRLRRKV